MSRSFSALLALVLLFACGAATAADRPNVLLITVDDMNADSVGVYGSGVPAITPNIDKLAGSGMRFEYAHVQVANCMPSRNVMWSGRYPHSNKVEGFVQQRDPGYPILVDLAKESGYFTAIRHKLKDSTPYTPYPWDLVLDTAASKGQEKGAAPPKYDKKNADSYGISTAVGIERAKAAGKPFLLLINIADPHLPFYGLDKKGRPITDPNPTSRVYTADEVVVPGYLLDDPVIRQELAHYYSSVRRADDAVGKVLDALEASGEADDTLVLLLSDHGMPFPFAKTQLYHHSTRTPLIVRWPSVVKANAVDGEHMVSAVDILPTLLASIGAEEPAGIEGRSFLPLLQGKVQDGRDWVIKEYNENSAGLRTPMRAVESRRFLYVFNPWSNGKRVMVSATRTTATHQRMVELAKDNAAIADRLDVLDHRQVEEFYDVENDPDCLVNLIADPDYQTDIANYRKILGQWMSATQDPMLAAFQDRGNPKALAAYMQEQNRITKERRAWVKAFKQSQKAAQPKPSSSPK